MTHKTYLALALLVACGSAQAAAGIVRIGPEFGPHSPLLSDDGRVLVGLFQNRAFYWTESGGRTDIQEFPTDYPNNQYELTGLSGDGSVVLMNPRGWVVGRPSQFWVPVLWSPGTGARIVEIPGTYAVARDVSSDGRTIAGFRQDLSGGFRGDEVFRWSAEGGLRIMPTPAGMSGHSFRDVDAISGDGRVVVGTYRDDFNRVRGYLWREGAEPLLIEPAAGQLFNDAVDVSYDGSRIAGNSHSRGAMGNIVYQPYVWDLGTGTTLLGILPGMESASAMEISGNGQVVVGAAYNPSGSKAFRWSAQNGLQSVQQWLAAYGVDLPENVALTTAATTNFDGSVLAGATSRGDIWLARVKGPAGGFLLDLAGYQRSLIDANQRLTQGIGALANATLSGSHHRSLLSNGLVDESDGSCAWANADVADYNASQTRTEQVEVGACTDLGPVRLGLGLGKAKARQDWNLGSRSTTEGEYLLGEAAFKMGAHWQGSVLGYSGRFDVDSQRRYYNGTAIHTSSARPDAKVSALRARLDWKDAVQVAGFGVSPYAAYTWTKTRLDGYTEHGGGFPSRFDRSDWSTRDLRLGAAFARGIGARNDLSVSLEAVRRLDKIASGTRGEIIDLFGFDLPGRALDRDWGQVLVDFDHRFANGSVLGLGARGASSGGEADWGVSAGYRLAF